MNNVNTIITSSEASVFFGSEVRTPGSVFEAIIRYTALTHLQGGIENLIPITTFMGEFYDSDGNKCINDYDYELVILSASGRTSLPIIDAEGWVSLNSPPYPVGSFLSTCSESRVYINKNTHRAIVFVKTKTEKWISALSAVIFRILPWRFNNGNPTETEHELFKAILEEDADTFAAIINKACEPYDFKALFLRKGLLGWGDRYRKNRLDQLKYESEELLRSIAKYQDNINNCLDKRSAILYDISLLEAQGDNASTEVFDFFTSRKQINIEYINKRENYIDYSVSETMEFFDKDDFIRIYNNSGSCIGTASEQVRKVLYAIFAESKGMFRTYATFRLHNLSSLDAEKHIQTQKYTNTHLPHPHLRRYECLGANAHYIVEAMKNGNWDVAVDQTISAVKNINFGDATVISYFVSLVINNFNSCKCIVTENEEEMTPYEFLNYINVNEEAQNA